MQEKFSNFGENLKFFLKAAGISQSQLAEKLGRSRNVVSMYILGKSFPQQEILKKLYELGCSVDFLLTGTGKPFADNDAGRGIEESLNRFYDDLLSYKSFVGSAKVADKQEVYG